MDFKDVSYVFLRSLCDSFKGIPKAFLLDKELQSRESNTPPRNRIFKPNKSNLQQQNKKKYKVLRCIIISSIVHLTVCVTGLYVFLPLLTWLSDLTTNYFVIHCIVAFVTYILLAIVIFLCKFINYLIFMDIGDSVFRYINGRALVSRSVTEMVSDTLFSSLFEFVFYMQAIAVTYIPIVFIAKSLHVVIMSLLYSLYIFEYKWCNMNIQFHSRVGFIEENWVYYLGFGLPFVIVTNYFDSYLANITTFSFLFPFFLISGSIATPVKAKIFPLRIFTTSANILTKIFKSIVATFPSKEPKPIKQS